MALLKYPIGSKSVLKELGVVVAAPYVLRPCQVTDGHIDHRFIILEMAYQNMFCRYCPVHIQSDRCKSSFQVYWRNFADNCGHPGIHWCLQEKMVG